MLNNTKIFFKGSKTYFTSSLFFPKKIRENVFTLYAFVRIADDYVDQAKQNPQKIKQFKKLYKDAESGRETSEIVINNFIKLKKEKGFAKKWIDAFLEAMIQDTKKSEYSTIDESIEYMYGSAEVIGLMMACVMDLDEKSHKYARLLGRSMQYANFIRDIDEDNMLGRQYIPTKMLKKYRLKNLYKEHIEHNQNNFNKLIRGEIKRFKKWQEEAEEGFAYIPKRYLVAIKTASDMYKWTINQIEKDPMIIYKKKVKPSRSFILYTALKNMISTHHYSFLPYVFLYTNTIT